MFIYNKIKNQLFLIRNIPLIQILLLSGAFRDKSDKNKWHTSRGIISVTNTKFFNWNQNIGGGGAIDLAIHLLQTDFKNAVTYLIKHFPELNNYSCTLSNQSYYSKNKPLSNITLRLPVKDDSKLNQVIYYLTYIRLLPSNIILQLIKSGKLYADSNANAVFLLLGKDNEIVGAELRGTTSNKWHKIARGSNKDKGFFSIGNFNAGKIILCESAIDAISCFALLDTRTTDNNNFMAISTAGVSNNPYWLRDYLKHDYIIYCGYDSDTVGDKMAINLIERYPAIKRLRPIKHDWNKLLIDKFNR